MRVTSRTGSTRKFVWEFEENKSRVLDAKREGSILKLAGARRTCALWGGALELGAKWFWDSCSLYILSLWTLHVHFAHGHIRVYGYATLCDTLKAALVEKLLFFRFAKKMFQYRFYGLYNSFYQPIRLRVKCWCFIRFTPYFSNHNLRSSSQNFGALSDTRVFGMPFLENMTLTVCFIIELFLFGKQITSGQSEKESTSINTSPIQ